MAGAATAKKKKAATTTTPRRTSSRGKPAPPPSSSSEEEVSSSEIEPPKSKKRASATSSAQKDEQTAKLCQILIDGHAALKDMPQQDDEEENDPVLMQLITRLSSLDVLQTQNAQVKYLAARCFADVLFVCSPNAPYPSATLKQVFWLIITSLNGLKQIPKEEQELEPNGAFACATYVLHKMAICKLSCILVDLPETEGGKLKTSEMVTEMFALLFASLSPKHAREVESDCVELLVGFMDEAGEEVEAMQIDQLLTPLLPESKRESMRAFDLAKSVLMQCTVSRVRKPVSNFLRGTLLGEFDLGRLAFMHACAEKCTINNQHTAFQVIIELFKINPELLLFVLPAVESVLEQPEPESRQAGVSLCCTLFWEMRNHDGLVAEHSKLLDAFLSRSLDGHKEIRLQVLKFACRVLSTHGGGGGRAAGKLVEAILHEDRLRMVELGLKDGNLEIRAECVEIASVVLTLFPDPHYQKKMAKWLGERLTDISAAIATRAMEGLAWCYNAQPKQFPWIPAALLTSNAKRESREEYHLVEVQRMSLLDNALVSGDNRIGRINLLWSQLELSEANQKAKQAFKRLAFTTRDVWRTHVLSALDDAKFCPKELLQDDEQAKMWRLIWSVKDRTVFDLFRHNLLSLTGSRREMLKAKKDVVERLGACWQSQKLSAEYIVKLKTFARDFVIRFSGLWTLNADDLLQGQGEDQELLDEQVLVAFIELFPDSFGEPLVERILEEASGLAICTVGCFVDFESFSEELGFQCKEKVMAVLNEDATLQTIAIKALLRLKYQGELVESFSDKPSNSWSLSELSVMLALCKASPAPLAGGLVDMLVENVKREYTGNSKEDEQEKQLKVVSVQLLAEYIVMQKQDEVEGGPGDGKAARIVLMLRSIVADMGDPWQAQRERQRNKFAPVAWPPLGQSKYVALRLACAGALMRVEAPSNSKLWQEGEDQATQLKRQGKRIVERSRLAFDPSADNRVAFAKLFVQLELELGVNMHRNAAFLCIIAAQQHEIKDNYALHELRSTVKFLAEQSQRAKLKEDEAHATLFAPELVLAHLVFVLAHHPLFPSDRELVGEFLREHSQLLTRPVLLLIDALALARPKPKELLDQSVCFLLGVLAKVRTQRDVLDWEDHAVHCVGDLARLVIQQYSIRCSPDSLQVYKGKVPLPRPMFVDIHDGSGKSAVLPRDVTPFSSTASMALSPVSYLPAGFDFDSLPVLLQRPRKRKSPETPKRPRASSSPSVKKSTARKRQRAEGEEGVSAKKQLPARAARMSLGGKSDFAESSSEEEEEDSQEEE
ncbi:hypothetical protein BASA81_001647 [Batrachochytrium salamandrivorans]|nr:hypothetical protein BASA81_001647 [Batrachochytrium salamandrivorans]